MEWVVIVGVAVIPVYTVWQMWPARMERLGRNAWIGLRTETTTQSDEHWRAAHQTAWPWVISTCALTLMVVIAGAFWVVRQADPVEESGLVAIVSMVVYGAGLVVATLAAQKAATQLGQ